MHLSDDDLKAYATGQVDASTAQLLEDHLCACDECGARLDGLRPADDPLIEALRGLDWSPADCRTSHAGQCDETLAAALPDRIGRYEVLGELGRGGMGIVYRAFDPRLQRAVALKVISQGCHSHPEDCLRLRREAEAAAHLQHANIVQIFDFGEQDGVTYYALELIEAGSLGERCSDRGWSDREAAEMLAVIAEAVEYAHRRHIVHRDLKPANVLLTGDGTPKIADFGLCRRLDEDAKRTMDGTLLGSPCYMAPEQARGEVSTVGPAADIYGLGAILYEMLTGRPPFRAATVAATLEQVRMREPDRPARYRHNVDRDLETICLKCLEKQAADRYETAAALTADLRRFLSGMPIVARNPTLAERTAKLARRHPGMAAMSAVLAVSLLVGFVVLLIYNDRLRESLEETRRRWEESRRNVYSLQLQRAKALESLEPDRACQLLDDEVRCPPELRDFTWKYVRGLCDRELAIWEPGGTTRCLAVAPDGCRFAAGDGDGMVRVWKNGATDGPRTLPGRSGPITDLAFHPSGAILASTSEDGTAKIWNLEHPGAPLVLTTTAERCNGVAFSPDGLYLATAHSDGGIRAWNAASGTCLATLSGQQGSAFRVSFSCDGKLLAGASKDENVRLWSVAGWRPAGSLSGHHGWVTDVRFHPVKPSILASGGEDRTVRLWQISDEGKHEPLATFRGFGGTVSSLAFSGDGRTLAAGSYDGTVRLWSFDSGQLQSVFRRHEDAVVSVAYSRPNQLLIASRNGRIRHCRTVAKDGCRIIEAHRKAVTSLVGVADGPIVASASYDGSLRFWDTDALQLVAQHQEPDHWFSCLSSARASEQIAWECNGAVYTARFDGRKLTGMRQSLAVALPSGLTLSPDGKRLAIAHSADASVLVFDNTTGKLLWKWDMGPSGETDGQGEAGIACLTFSPVQGLLAVAGGAEDGFIQILGREGRPFAKPLPSCGEGVKSMTFFADESRLAVGTKSGHILVYDVAMRRIAWQSDGHAAEVTCVAFSADGRTLASGAADGDIRLWDATAGSERSRINMPCGICSLVFASSGATLVAGCDDGTLRLWHVEP
jgi:WD40 repeat protein